MPQNHSALLAVFAHPDDETSAAPMLARYAREGHPVYLACITSGQKGSKHTSIPQGEELGRVREAELRCAARALGIVEPRLLGFQDQGISDPPASGAVVERLRALLAETRAEVVVTFGPDGLTGHPDHRAASNLTTQAFQQQGALEHRPKKLYYVEWPEALLARPPVRASRLGNMHSTSEEFLTTIIECEDYLDAAEQAIGCHATQWSPERMRQIRDLTRQAFRGRVFLRLALTTIPDLPLPENDVFAGLL